MRRVFTSKVLICLMSFVVLTGMFPLLTADAFAFSDTSSGNIPEEICDQLQDDDADPFGSGKSDEMQALEVKSSFPEKFDLRKVDTDNDGVADSNYVTPVKFQNPFSTCWGFAAISAAETSILGNKEINYNEDKEPFSTSLAQGADGREIIDLSEKHLVRFLNLHITDKNEPQFGEGGYYTGVKIGSGDLNTGGFPFNATSLFSCGVGPVLENLESVLEYHGNKKKVFRRSGKPYCYSADDDWSVKTSYMTESDWRFYQSYRLKESYILPTPANKTGTSRDAAINAIKEELYSKRSVSVGFCADTSQPGTEDSAKATKYLSSDWAHYTYDNGRANHAVAIVGWDDSYPKENFRHKIADKSDDEAYALTTPEHDGAWLVKNSWGSSTEEFPNRGSGTWGIDEGNGPNGYFWLSYDDKSVTTPEALNFDINNVEDEYLIYQHDFMPVNRVNAASGADKMYMANVFTSEFPSRLEQVTCQTTEQNTTVQYDIYILGRNASSPVDGQKVAQIRKTYKYGGFHKESLDTPIITMNGQRFSVVLTQTTSAGKYTISTQTAYNKKDADTYNKTHSNKVYTYAKGVINKGESLLYTDGGWYDLSVKSVKEDLVGKENLKTRDLDNFPIKVYAGIADSSEEPTVFDRDYQPGTDGTFFGKGASYEAADSAARAWKKNSSPAGAKKAPLDLKCSKKAKNYLKIKWNAQEDAAKYVVYAAKKGASNKLKRVGEFTGSSCRITKIGSTRLKKSTKYKFMVIAFDGDNNVLSSSGLIIASTKKK